MKMPPEVYPEWRKSRCEYCAVGMPMSGYKKHHWTGNQNPPVCTAPTEAEYIAQLEARVTALEKGEQSMELQQTEMIQTKRRPTDSKTDSDESAASGLALIGSERTRQVGVEGWTPEHDDQHSNGEIALAAICYAAPVPVKAKLPVLLPGRVFSEEAWQDPWPWESKWDKRDKHDPIRRLAISGALIAAEIDRLQRCSATPITVLEKGEEQDGSSTQNRAKPEEIIELRGQLEAVTEALRGMPCLCGEDIQCFKPYTCKRCSVLAKIGGKP